MLCGALNEISTTDRALTATLLDEAASDDLLRPIIVMLHPQGSFSDQDFERCLAALRDTDNPHGFEVLLWRDEYQDGGSARAEELASVMVTKEGGEHALLEGLSMRLHNKEDTEGLLGKRLRSLALRAAAKQLLKHDNDPGGNGDYRMNGSLGTASSTIVKMRRLESCLTVYLTRKTGPQCTTIGSTLPSLL